MTIAKRKKAVAAIRQIIKAARELIKIEDSIDTQAGAELEPSRGGADSSDLGSSRLGPTQTAGNPDAKK